jgi:hypothetical protein
MLLKKLLSVIARGSAFTKIDPVNAFHQSSQPKNQDNRLINQGTIYKTYGEKSQ